MSQSEGQTLRYVGVAFKWASEHLDTDSLDEVPVGEFESTTREGVVDWAREQAAQGGGRVRVFIVCEELVAFDYGRDWIGTGVTGEVDPSGSAWWSDGYRETAPAPVSDGLRCPVCGGVDVTGDEWEMDCDIQQAWQGVSCDDCGSSWIDVYGFTHRENVYEGDRVEIARARQAARS